MQSNSIFRQVALERLSSPEQLDQIVQVTSPKSWLALLAIGALLVTAVIWSIVGRIPVEISGSAILLNSGGVKNIVSVESGQITEFYLAPGQLIDQGQLIAKVSMPGAAEAVPVYSPYNGRVLELKADVGNLIGPGSPLASIKPAGPFTNSIRSTIDISSVSEPQGISTFIPLQKAAILDPRMLIRA